MTGAELLLVVGVELLLVAGAELMGLYWVKVRIVIFKIIISYKLISLFLLLMYSSLNHYSRPGTFSGT